MLYKGKPLVSPNIEICVIPRSDEDIIIKAQAVLDFTEHDALNPRPIPPIVTKIGGNKEENTNNPKYLETLDIWASRKFSWTVLKSLEPTGFTWEKVKFDNPETWELYEQEFKESNFTPAEIRRILDTIAIANGLNQKRIDEATQSFLAGQVQEKSS